MSYDPVARLRALPLGARVVVRRRVQGGFSDAVGYLRSCLEDTATVDTRRGPVTITLGDVVAAKPVPEPPPRRNRYGAPRP